MTPEEQDCYDALREDNDCLKQENDALAARLAHAEACLAEKHLRLAEAEKECNSWKQEAMLMAAHQGIDNYQRLLNRLAEAEGLLIEGTRFPMLTGKRADWLIRARDWLGPKRPADSAAAQETESHE